MAAVTGSLEQPEQENRQTFSTLPRDKRSEVQDFWGVSVRCIYKASEHVLSFLRPSLDSTGRKTGGESILEVMKWS